MNNIIDQYKTIKAKYPDALLLFRIGDYYELFNADAKTAAIILGLELKISKGDKTMTHEASFPYYSLDSHLQKLVRAGYRVAVCEQLENPKADKKIKRGVTDVKYLMPLITAF
jgi:DNA mismatch repair protein MutS